MTSPWVEETENPSPTQWLDRFGSALDGNDLNTRQFSNSIFGPNDHIHDVATIRPSDYNRPRKDEPSWGNTPNARKQEITKSRVEIRQPAVHKLVNQIRSSPFRNRTSLDSQSGSAFYSSSAVSIKCNGKNFQPLPPCSDAKNTVVAMAMAMAMAHPLIVSNQNFGSETTRFDLFNLIVKRTGNKRIMSQLGSSHLSH
ncbi:hypothetical protein Ccrd_017009 [Cynara cardunculus var. scolymus]|uniref:Uncharacterized protein n=1 Tax=Cynara cardunculus var. scolymus TaxID=59895 RepID=A0A103Y8X5_CYNCS|nr:hypothetical protein Ccrd_017009 [Cynara cardunculus var. scolymus]